MEDIKLIDYELPYEIAEESKRLRSNLLFCGTEKKVILVTSAMSNEGKSSVSLLLAKSLADMGKNVLLIDCDLRKSVLAEQFEGSSMRQGLSHLLSGQKKMGDVIYHVDNSPLDILPAGAVPPNPVELLLGERMQKLVEFAREKYDYLILDCPPVGMVSDAVAVAPLCDGVLLVIAAGEISRGFALRVKEQLQKTGTPLLGAILNRVNAKTQGAYGKYGRYGKYSKYSKYGIY